MSSLLFPQLDKSYVKRLLRSGLRIDPSEPGLFEAAEQLARLDIIKLFEAQAIRCANPNDEDFPQDVIDESCEGLIQLSYRILADKSQSTVDAPPYIQHQAEDRLASNLAIHQCPSCGRFIEYADTGKELFVLWATTLIPAGLHAYVEAANLALLEGMQPDWIAPSEKLTAHDLLTEGRPQLRQRLSRTDSVNRPNRRYGHRNSISQTERFRWQTLHDSLLGAFPTKQVLARMLKYELDINLDEIAANGNLNDIIYDIIVLAESESWLTDLVHAAQRANSGNQQLAQLQL